MRLSGIIWKSQNILLNMKLLKRFELLQINLNIFLFKQSRIDQDKSYILEHMDKINRYLRDLKSVLL